MLKINQQNLLSDSKNVSDSIAYLGQGKFNIPKHIWVSTYRIIASAFEYENRASREINNHTKRFNWSSFKEAPYRNLKLVDNLSGV